MALAIVIAVVAVIAVAIVAATLATRRYPFEIFAFLTRRKLAKAGLQRKQLDDLVYWTGGLGKETLVLVHGTNDQAGTWSPVVPELVKRYRLIIPDLPGHGESAPASGPLDMQKIVDGFTRILAAAGDAQLLLAGNSMGGWVVMLYALAHPQKVTHLVLEASGGMSWDTTRLPLVPQTREEAARAMRAVLGPDARLPPDYVLDAMVRRGPTTAMKRLLQSNVLPFILDHRLGHLTTPVTMIWGDNDGVLPVDYARVFQSRIANAELHIIEDCGHIPHRQKPDQFRTLLEDAIRV